MVQRRGTSNTDYLFGTADDDDLWGYGGDDHLYGFGGVDWLYGDGGVDRLYGDQGDDHLFGGSEDDWLYGGPDKDYLDGGTGNDILDGGTGPDTMVGGQGSDTYYVDFELDDTVEESGPGSGFDTVYSTVDHVLQDNIEKLVLTGTAVVGVGNASDNFIYGNSLNNWLTGGPIDAVDDSGDDYIDGGAGADTMIGRGGDDRYYVDNADDSVWEHPGGGFDRVFSTVNYALPDIVDGVEVEDLYLLSGSAAVTGIGNSLANGIYGNERSNLLLGGEGNDDIDGGAGADTMWGGRGDDEFWVDDPDDNPQEFYRDGFDTVWSRIDYTLGVNIEDLRLLSGARDGTGNNLGNGIWGTESQNWLRGAGGIDTIRGMGGQDFLFGDAGSDHLYGGTGADTLTGGSEGDFFVFDDINETSELFLGATRYDRITDFSSAPGDKIVLSGIDANGAADGDPMFSYIGPSAFHRIAGELRYGGRFVEGDINGDAVFDFRIEVDVASLARGDFIL
jgi:Ca2+-binding RTX toxin-like protein